MLWGELVSREQAFSMRQWEWIRYQLCSFSLGTDVTYALGRQPFKRQDTISS